MIFSRSAKIPLSLGGTAASPSTVAKCSTDADGGAAVPPAVFPLDGEDPGNNRVSHQTLGGSDEQWRRKFRNSRTGVSPVNRTLDRRSACLFYQYASWKLTLQE